MVFALVFLLSAWASLMLERHTVQEFMLGRFCYVDGFAIGWFQNTLRMENAPDWKTHSRCFSAFKLLSIKQK